MVYEYQYTIVAVAASFVLVILNYQRKSYSSYSNRVFASLLYSNLLAALIDIVTYWTISFPQRYSISFLYASNIVYLIIYGIVGSNFLRYVAALLNNEHYIRTSKWMFAGAVALQVVLVSATPFTHWIIYYDENLVYRHGELFGILYLIPVAMIGHSLLLFWLQKKNFSRFQHITVLTLFVLSIAMATVQVLVPSLDIFHLMCALILYVVYIVFENPAYYTYHSTRCFNNKAFYEEANRLGRKKIPHPMLLICVMNKRRNHSIQEVLLQIDLMDSVAEELRNLFGRRVYCIDKARFVLIPKSGTQDEVCKRLNTHFKDPIDVKGIKIKAEICYREFDLQEIASSGDYIDHLMEAIRQTGVNELMSTPELLRLVQRQHEYREIEDIITTALNNHLFNVVYQPIYDLRNGKFRSAEALLRMEDTVKGKIGPDVFVPIAEKNRSIIQLGNYMFDKVCQFWSSDERKQSSLELVQINVSPVQLTEENMASIFIEIMDKYHVNPSEINLEITESEEVVSNQCFLHNLSMLREKGVQFAVDDYGSGFSSADYLYKLPISIVKLDRKIIWQAMKEPKAMCVFEHLIHMGKDLGKEIVVQGAETAEMIQVIQKTGADYIQGFYYSKPLTQNELTAFCMKT